MVRRVRRTGVLGLFLAAILALPVVALGDGPRAHAACGEATTSPCSESGNVSLPADSTGGQKTDTVPDSAHTGLDELQPLSATDLAAFDATWDTVVEGAPQLGKVKNVILRRVLTCDVIAKGAAATAGSEDVTAMDTIDTNDFYAAFLAACIQVTVLGQHHAAAQTSGAAAAPRGCGVVRVAVPFTAMRTARGWHIVFNGKTHRARGRAALRVTCRVHGRGLVITERPRHGSLRRTVGPHLAIGFSNPTSKPVAFRTTFTFR